MAVLGLAWPIPAQADPITLYYHTTTIQGAFTTYPSTGYPKAVKYDLPDSQQYEVESLGIMSAGRAAVFPANTNIVIRIWDASGSPLYTSDVFDWSGQSAALALRTMYIDTAHVQVSGSFYGGYQLAAGAPMEFGFKVDVPSGNQYGHSYTYKVSTGTWTSYTSDDIWFDATVRSLSLAWDGGTGNWAADNWSGGQTPTANAAMTIDAAGNDSVVTVAADFITGGTGPAASLAVGANHTASLTVNGGVTLEVTGAVDIGGSGTMLVNGTLTTAGVTVAGGATLGGSGTITSTNPVNMYSGSTLAPGASVGTLTVNNDLTFMGGGNTWIAELLGTDDRVNVTGALTLGDATALEFPFDGANPFQAGTYTLADCGTLTDGTTFSSVTNLGAYTPGVVYDYVNDEITIEVEAGLLPGDANLDRTVNLDDFARLRNNFGVGDTWAEADFNGDDTVNLDDFAILRNNFGSHTPEPATLALLGLGGAWLAFRRRRHGTKGTSMKSALKKMAGGLVASSPPLPRACATWLHGRRPARGVQAR